MLLIFDWDGTLADSCAHIVAAMQQTIVSMGLPARTDKQCADMIGLGLRETALTLFADLQVEDVDHFCTNYSRHFLALGKTDFPLLLFSGVAETLTELKSQGHTLAIATGKSRKGLDRVLAQTTIFSLFSATRTTDESASKPNPLMLQMLLKDTQKSVDEAVMIGDTSYDLGMAKNIEMARIGVSYGVHSADELTTYNPSLMLDRIEDLLGWSGL